MIVRHVSLRLRDADVDGGFEQWTLKGCFSTSAWSNFETGVDARGMMRSGLREIAC